MSLQKNIRLLTWFNFFTDFKMYGPIAIIYFSHISHSYALGGLVFSIAYIVSALFDVPTGIFADRIGRKKTIILGAVFAALFVIFYAIGLNFWLLAVGAFFEGLSRAFYSGNNNALLHNMLSDEGMEHDYHVYLGRLTSWFQIALAVSGLLGAFIANFSFPLVMWLSVIPQVVCLYISFQITDRSNNKISETSVIQDLKRGFAAFKNNANLRLLTISSILDYGFGETSYQFQAAFYNTILPIWAVGIAKTLSNIGAAIGFRFSGWVINKLGAINTLFYGEIYGKCVAFFSLIVITKLSPFLMSTSSIFFGTGSIAEASLMQKEFSDQQRATMSSLNSFAGSLFFGILVYLIGFLADKFDPRNALLLLQIGSLSVLYILWRLFKQNRNISKIHLE